MSLRPSRVLVPARVLKIVRDFGPIASFDIIEHLEPGHDRQRTLLIDSVEAMLTRFEVARLVMRKPAAGGSNRPMLPGSMMPAAAQRALEEAPPSGEVEMWQMTDALLHLQRALGVSLSELAARQECESDPLVQQLRDAVQRLRAQSEIVVRDHLAPCLDEIATCTAVHCYTAALSLSGKALELVIKRQLVMLGERFDDNLMLGPLLGRLRDLASTRTDISAAMLDPALAHVANVINQHRIAAIHAKRMGTQPTDDQTRMVLHALLDIVRRTLLEV